MFFGIFVFVAILQSTFTDGMTTAPNKCSEIKELDKIHQKMEDMLDRFDILQRVNEILLGKIDLLPMDVILSKFELLQKDNEILRAKIELLLDGESNLINKNELLIKDLKINAQALAEKRNQTRFLPLGILIPNIEKGKLNDLTNSQHTSPQDPKEQSFQNPLVNATHIPKNCTQAMGEYGRSGVYQIEIANVGFNTYCLKDADFDHNAWLIIQRRKNHAIDFDLKWTEYQHGFGNLKENLFFGLEKLHALTQSARHELWIQMRSFEGAKRWAKYDNFSIGNASDGYRLKSLGTYTGDAGDSLSEYINQEWSMSNKQYKMFSCAQLFKWTWWYNGNCGGSNLNLPYYGDHIGIFWNTFRTRSNSLRQTHMAIRPVN